MKYWKKLSVEEQRNHIESGLAKNIDYKYRSSLGVPASRLDGKVFYDQAPFLAEAPFL